MLDDLEREELNRLAERATEAVHEVANTLGGGFLEKVYQRALVAELRLAGLRAEAAIQIYYKGQPVGEYYADILVEGKLILELKCVDCFTNEHVAQCINYLKATHRHLALLINFRRSKASIRRVVHDF
jgi:GxxExxY protein